jgi:hypothetical protein
MIRITDNMKTGSLVLKEAVEILKNSAQPEPITPAPIESTTTDQSGRTHVMREIQELEAKIEEVNQLLCKTNLEYMVRFQLKDDLEYYHSLIEAKRSQLGV